MGKRRKETIRRTVYKKTEWCSDTRTFTFELDGVEHTSYPMESTRLLRDGWTVDNRTDPQPGILAPRSDIFAAYDNQSVFNDVCDGPETGWDGPWCQGAAELDVGQERPVGWPKCTHPRDTSGLSWVAPCTGIQIHPHATMNCPAPAPGRAIGDLVPCWKPVKPCTSSPGGELEDRIGISETWWRGTCNPKYRCGESACVKLVDPALEQDVYGQKQLDKALREEWPWWVLLGFGIFLILHGLECSSKEGETARRVSRRMSAATPRPIKSAVPRRLSDWASKLVEDGWEERLDNLCERFPGKSREEVARSLQKFNGHSGEAASDLTAQGAVDPAASAKPTDVEPTLVLATAVSSNDDLGGVEIVRAI